MCGRFTLRTNLSLIAHSFQIETWEEFSPRYNIAPESMVACVRHDEEERRQLVFLQWGLIPSWAKDPTVGRTLINARGESVATKPSFRSAFRSRRCLVLADGFYEWQRQGSKRKQPYYIRLRDDQPFAFAGLWERWSNNGLELQTCTVITTEANELLKPIHDRMPVILHREDLDDWLHPESDRGSSLLGPYPSESMMAIPVSDLVNRASYDSPDCIEPLTTTGPLRPSSQPSPPIQRQRTLFD